MELELPIVLNATNRLIPRFFVGYEHDFMGDTNQEHELKSEFAKLPALGNGRAGQNRGSDDLDLALSIELEPAIPSPSWKFVDPSGATARNLLRRRIRVRW